MRSRKIIIGIIAIILLLIFSFRFVTAPILARNGRITLEDYASRATFSAIAVSLFSAIAACCFFRRTEKMRRCSAFPLVMIGLVGAGVAIFLNIVMREGITEDIVNASMPEAIRKSVISVIGTLVGGFGVGFGLTTFDANRIIRRKQKPAPDRILSANAAVSKTAAAILAFLLGGLGVHRYYLGYKKQGAAQTCGFISLVSTYTYSVTKFVFENKPSAGEAVFLLFLVLYGAAVSIWAFVDFIRILTGSLQPANGNTYSENRPQQVRIVEQKEKASDIADVIGKIAKLHEQGVLTEEEFRKKKAELLAKMG